MKLVLLSLVTLAFAATIVTPFNVRAAGTDCPKFKVYYIDPATKFIAPPVPIEQNAQKIFCSASPQIERLMKSLDQLKPIKKRASDSTARIKIVPTGADAENESIVIHDNGEVVRRMNTYHPQPKQMFRLLGTLKSEAAQAKD
jgi:hypothetical protein